MSGHSKWASIKHKKGAADAKRGKIFSKIIKEITIAARMGGGDEDANPRLRTAILKAKAANMPKDNISRAVKKGSGELGSSEYFELSYEGYGPNGVAILVEALTDNKNRTAADVRSIFSKNGGNLGESGCVSYMFSRKGIIAYDGEKYSEDDILEVALEAGADDVEGSDGAIEVTTAPEEFENVLNAMEAAGYQHEMAEISRVPESTVSLSPEGTRKAIRLLNLLEDNDDVQEVASNLDVPDDFDEEA